MNHFYQLALQKLGFRQQAYRSMFAEGSPAHLVLVDLAKFVRAFEPDTTGLSDAQLRELRGRQQVFFRITHHLKLTPSELELVYRNALVSAANKLQGGDHD